MLTDADWNQAREALLHLISPARCEMLDRILENAKNDLNAELVRLAPARALARAFNFDRQQRILNMRIKRRLLNNHRKDRGLKPYRPKISVFAKPKETYKPAMIRRIIPGTIAFDIN